MAEKYYQFLSDLTESCGAYRVVSAADAPDAAYHSRVGVPTPHANDFLTVSDSGALQIYRPSDPDVFTGIEFEHFPASDQLLANGVLHELTPDETRNFQSLRVQIDKATADLHTISGHMTEPNAADSAIIELKQQEIDLQATLHRLQLSLQPAQSIRNTQRENAALIQAMQNAGYRQVSPSVSAVGLRFENPRTGQLHTFHSAQQAQEFLHKQSLAATLYFRHTPEITEKVEYFSGEEQAALEAYQSAMNDFGAEAVDYQIEPDAAYDRLGYQFLCAYAAAYGHTPARSEIEYISHREMRRMEQRPMDAVSVPLQLEPTEVVAMSYREPNGEQVELHFTQHEADTAVFAFHQIMEQGQTPDLLVADTAADLDYALYQKYCDATGAASRLDEEQFMARFHRNAAGERTIHQGTDDPLVGEGVGFERIRRITGYLVGDLDRFNNAKRAEVHDRLAHSTGQAAPLSLSGPQKSMDGPEL